jgi:hypothetical protein
VQARGKESDIYRQQPPVADTKKPLAAKAAQRQNYNNGSLFSYPVKRGGRCHHRIATAITGPVSLYFTAIRGLVDTGHIPRPVLGQDEFRQFGVNRTALNAEDVNPILVTLDIQVSEVDPISWTAQGSN